MWPRFGLPAFGLDQAWQSSAPGLLPSPPFPLRKFVMTLRLQMRVLALAVPLAMLVGCAAPQPQPALPTQPQPPVAAVHPFDVQSPNGVRVDNYYWLRDDTRSRPEVLDYVKAENAYYAAMTAHTKALEDTLYNEIVGRIKQDDSTVPAKYKHYFYYTRFEQGAEYPVYARRKGSADGLEQVMLDGNAMAKGHDFFQIAGTQISPNEQLLAYGEDDIGRRQYTIHVKDLATGKILPDEIRNTSASMAWADDNKSLFYVENDPITLLTVRVKKHLLGTDAARDPVVYEERDHSFYMGVGRSGDDKYIVIDEHSTLSSEIRFLPAAQPKARFRVIAPREHDFEYHADHIDQRWVIRTNWGGASGAAKNFRVMQVDDARVGDKKGWRELVPVRNDVLIEQIAPFRNFLAIEERSDGLQRVRIKPWRDRADCSAEGTRTGQRGLFPHPALRATLSRGAGEDKSERPPAAKSCLAGAESYVKGDDADYTASIGDNREQDTDTLRYNYTSLITPNTVYDLNMKTGQRDLKKRDPVLGGYDPANYTAERLWATARDGTKIPVSLAYRKDFKRDGTAPLYQYGYGSYGASTDPRFSSPRFSLIDRGFVYAIAHVRGGQEMGRSWYEDGKLLKKKNTFTDFIDVTEFLVKYGYAAKDKCFAEGGSAGGLLLGAVATMAPQDYRAIAAHVPFVDVVTTMLDESIPLTTNEFDEWGNPKETIYYNYMLSYSPYDNVSAQAYPALLVTTGLWDSQVQYYEPTKWVAKLRATKTDRKPLLLKVNMEAGHGGKSGRFQRYREVAQEFAFLIDQLPKTAPAPPAAK
jgi:oligopeptidase B